MRLLIRIPVKLVTTEYDKFENISGHFILGINKKISIISFICFIKSLSKRSLSKNLDKNRWNLQWNLQILFKWRKTSITKGMDTCYSWPVLLSILKVKKWIWISVGTVSTWCAPFHVRIKRISRKFLKKIGQGITKVVYIIIIQIHIPVKNAYLYKI